MLFTMLRFLFIATVFINTVFYRGAKEEEEGGGWNINRAQWRAAPSAHRQPLLFLFPFSFSFPFVFFFVFCILYCSREQWRAAHHQPPPFPLPVTALPLPLLILLRILHSPLSEEEDQKQSTMDSNSLNSPPTFAVFTTSHSSFPSHSPSPSPSSSTCSTIHVTNEELLHCSWPSRVRPKPNCQVSGSDPVKKIQKYFSDIVFYLRN